MAPALALVVVTVITIAIPAVAHLGAGTVLRTSLGLMARQTERNIFVLRIGMTELPDIGCRHNMAIIAIVRGIMRDGFVISVIYVL